MWTASGALLAPARFGASLRAIRLELGLTQKQLAEQLDVPRSYVRKYEAGEWRLDLVELEAVAGALGVALTTIVWRFESKLDEGRA